MSSSQSPRPTKKLGIDLVSYNDYRGCAISIIDPIVRNFVFWTGFKQHELTVEVVDPLKTKLDPAVDFDDVFLMPSRDEEDSLGELLFHLAIARASIALAAAARGTIHLAIPSHVSETDPYSKKNSHWVYYEYNTLTRNENIDEIFRVDPQNWNEKKRIWKKGDPPFGDEANPDAPLPKRQP